MPDSEAAYFERAGTYSVERKPFKSFATPGNEYLSKVTSNSIRCPRASYYVSRYPKQRWHCSRIPLTQHLYINNSASTSTTVRGVLDWQVKACYRIIPARFSFIDRPLNHLVSKRAYSVFVSLQATDQQHNWLGVRIRPTASFYY